MLRLTALAAVPVAAILFGGPVAQAEPPNATVTRIVDGDTVDIRYDSGGTDRIRMLGIDTPETRGVVECWGPEATGYATQELLNRRVAVYTDSSQDERDRYNRLLAFVERDDSGWFYSVEAARAGAGRNKVYEDPTQLQPDIAAAEQEARSAGRGLWGPPCNGGV